MALCLYLPIISIKSAPQTAMEKGRFFNSERNERQMSVTRMFNDVHERAHEIQRGLPTPDYPVNFQPTFPDERRLFCGIRDLVAMEGVTTPRDIDYFRTAAGITAGIVLFGSCHEVVDLRVPAKEKAKAVHQGLEIVGQTELDGMLAVYRGLRQSTKPRSDEFESLPDGRVVPSFMGDEVNGKHIDNRTPDPVRMVDSHLQALSIRQELVRGTRGIHIPTAHEALLLAGELPFIRQDPETGKFYLLSADLPWIGVRTNRADGPHVDMLSGVENTVGVKIDATSDEDHIRKLTDKLNPDRLPGKLLFMVRVELEQLDELELIVGAIAKHSPNSRLLYDMHGATKKTVNGKVRAVPDILQGITNLSEVAQSAGLPLSGGHFETTHEDRLECIDEDGQLPTHPGEIDPRLNPSQTKIVYDHLANEMRKG